MAEALVFFLVEQLGSIIFQQVEQNVRLVVNVEKEVRNLTLNLEAILAVLTDAERRQVKEDSVRRWLNNLKQVSCEIDDVVDEWSTEILKQQIEKQGENAVVVPKKKQKFYKFLQSKTEFEQPERLKSFSIVDKTGTFGREYERNKLVSQLVSENSEERKLHLAISVVDPFVQITVAKAILEGLKVKDPKSNELETYLQHISNSIEGKKFLLVLDDVWDSNHRKWEPFLTTLQCGGSGSRILVTTRIAQVASTLGATSDRTIHLKELGEENCRSLFYHIAFFDGGRKESKKFEDIGNEIVKKCKGLPLAARTLGSLMRCKKTVQQWVDVLNNYRIVKDELIELWMSQDYLEVKGGNQEKKIVGQWCFENLVMQSFFKDIEEDLEGNIRSCKMHDIVHDFLQYLTKDECFSMVVKGANERMELPGDEVRHLSLMFAPKGPFPVSFLNCKSLRTLTTFESELTSYTNELISQSKSLRTLNLSKNSILEVPKEIGGLIHLRYLDLSHNRELKELPDSLCDLYNLQTLRLVKCCELVKFPDEEAMRKLTKLKHLYVEGSPHVKSKGIRSLTGLQKLDVFHLNGYKGADKEGTLKLQDLKNLNQLEGSLSIAHLESVEDASEGVKACLSEKHLLHHLKLDFACFDGWHVPERKGTGHNDREILNALQPHGDLESLSIISGLATCFSCLCPNWILSLHKLTRLELQYFRNCELLSGPFGRLPSLESFAVGGMGKVKKVGVEFLGLDSSSSSCLTLFPKLKNLEFAEMPRWEQWEGVGGYFQNNITIMPSLSRLRFYRCSKLGTLPDFLHKTPLQSVTVEHSPFLTPKTSEEWAKISHSPHIQRCKIDMKFADI
ncbi:putative disease resistance protein RGA3 [Rosa chinensis]|uniref:putative disease resistance protein RGA3 n=1 Tax=Rosa chinensis TaxID=74649 RepID=UPI001AD8DF4E|nr:putative disease resistance protein RGA3 [Rosa chinensis]